MNLSVISLFYTVLETIKDLINIDTFRILQKDGTKLVNSLYYTEKIVEPKRLNHRAWECRENTKQ